MRVTDFQFDLPDHLIARYPLTQRSASRLLVLDGSSGALAHRQFQDLSEILQPNDLLVFNNTKVIPARLFARKQTGGKIEVLVERVLDDRHTLAHVRASKAAKPGDLLYFEQGISAQVLQRRAALFELVFDRPVLEMLEHIGHMPLPPYIDRADELADRERYQTIYAQQVGAVAAPTAGLHFDQPLLDKLTAMGVNSTFVTLHVGAGTFQPVRGEVVEEHQMHDEWLQLDQAVVDAVECCKAQGGRVIAVGTTSVRSLETAARDGQLKPFRGDTNIFIYPGRAFRVVDALITNFHLPKSTLLMLVSAFAGHSSVMAAYQAAIAQKYRFFSYGDAMFITRNPQPDSPGK